MKLYGTQGGATNTSCAEIENVSSPNCAVPWPRCTANTALPRLRYSRDEAQALIDGTGSKDRVGIRLAPLTTLNGCVDADPETTYTAAARLLGALGVSYIHIAEADWDDAPHMPMAFKQRLRDVFPGTLIYAGKYTAEIGRAHV